MSAAAGGGVLHIYAVRLQPATAFVDDCGEAEIHAGHAPDKMLFCDTCGECWPAAQMVVQCCYDGWRYWCADGHGCKDKARVAAHKERSRQRRSWAAREAWAERKERAALSNIEGGQS